METSNRMQLIRALANRYYQSKRSVDEATKEVLIELGVHEIMVSGMSTDDRIKDAVYRLLDQQEAVKS